MLTRDRGLIVFTCDTCPDAHETGTRDSDEARIWLRDAGWMTVRVDEEWVHLRGCCG